MENSSDRDHRCAIKTIIFQFCAMIFNAVRKDEQLRWKNSPIKTDSASLHKVNIFSSAEKTTTATDNEPHHKNHKQLPPKQNMSKDEYSKFLDIATSMFEDSPVKPKQRDVEPQSIKISQQVQSEFDLLFASPNESFEITPFEYDLEGPDGEGHKMDVEAENEPPQNNNEVDFQTLLQNAAQQTVEMSVDSLDIDALKKSVLTSTGSVAGLTSRTQSISDNNHKTHHNQHSTASSIYPVRPKPNDKFAKFNSCMYQQQLPWRW